MKKLITLIFILHSFIISNAQDITPQTFYDRYDKILSRERTYFITNGYFMPICDPDEICDSTKNIDYCQRFGIQRIKYIEQYLLDSMPNIRNVAITMICSIGANSKIKSVRQLAVVDMLNSMYTAIDVSGIDSYMMFFRAQDFNDSAKNRIKELLRGIVSELEKRLMFEYHSNYFIAHSRYFDVEGHYIAKRDSLPFEYVRDSLINIEKKKSYKDTIYHYDIGGFYNISLLPGILYMYDFVPELEQMKKNRMYYEFYDNIKLDLARMGNKQYENEMLKQGSVNAFFINTQSAAEFYIKNYVNNDSLIKVYDDFNIKKPISWDAYYYIQDWILNLPKKYKLTWEQYCDLDEKNEQKKKFVAGRKWLNKNIGKFELNSNISVNFGFEE